MGNWFKTTSALTSFAYDNKAIYTGKSMANKCELLTSCKLMYQQSFQILGFWLANPIGGVHALNPSTWEVKGYVPDKAAWWESLVHIPVAIKSLFLDFRAKLSLHHTIVF